MLTTCFLVEDMGWLNIDGVRFIFLLEFNRQAGVVVLKHINCIPCWEFGGLSTWQSNKPCHIECVDTN
jgi:hypothetical protein